MSQLNLHIAEPLKAPPQRSGEHLPVVTKSIEVYKIWHTALRQMPNTSRYTLGSKIDEYLGGIIESLTLASYIEKEKKLLHINHASSRIDLAKLFLQIAWEIQALDTKQFTHMSLMLVEIGKMVGGWKRQLNKTNPRS